jgi:hypothetical protein
MNAPNQLDQALEALRQEHRSIQSPAALEKAILERATLQQTLPRVRPFPLYAWSLALAAAAIAIAIVILYPRPSHPTVATQTTTLPTPKPIQTPSTLPTNVQPALRRPHAKRRPATRNQSSPGPFVPLPTGTGLPEPTQAMLIRTRINTSSLRSYGLTPPPPGAPQTILAEFLVGEDGLPRAIRLIR